MSAHSLKLLALMAALMTLSACSHHPRRYEERTRATIEALTAAPEAEAWVAAALVMHLDRRPPADVLAQLARATAADPTRPEWHWLQSQQCAIVDGCDPRPLEARLRALDPDNGAGWYGELSRAVAAKDAAATEVALQKLAEAPAFHLYWTKTVPALSGVASQPKTWRLLDSLTSMTSAYAGIGMPSFSVVIDPCRDEALALLHRRERCRAMAQSLMRGDTLIAELIGINIAKQAWPEDSPEWRAATEARRVHDYRVDQVTQHPRRSVWEMFFRTEDVLQRFSAARREQDLMVAQLVQWKIDPRPPDDWTRESHRQ